MFSKYLFFQKMTQNMRQYIWNLIHKVSHFFSKYKKPSKNCVAISKIYFQIYFIFQNVYFCKPHFL